MGKITLIQHQQGNSIIILKTIKTFYFRVILPPPPMFPPRINFGLQPLVYGLGSDFQIFVTIREQFHMFFHSFVVF